MDAVAQLVTVTAPRYLAALPVPDSFEGMLKMGARDWLALLPLGAAAAGVGYLAYRAFCPWAHACCAKKAHINKSVKKDLEKVVDVVDVEDIGDKAAFCRCWMSKKFPYCDGSHSVWNKETNDNVGPICVQRKK